MQQNDNKFLKESYCSTPVKKNGQELSERERMGLFSHNSLIIFPISGGSGLKRSPSSERRRSALF